MINNRPVVFPKAKEECPFVDRSFTPDANNNNPVDYDTSGGDIYRFYKHHFLDDRPYNCQFCMLIGRKRDVFECLNENEWKACSHYKGNEDKVTKTL